MLMLKTATVLEAISKRRHTARPAAHAGLSKTPSLLSRMTPRTP